MSVTFWNIKNNKTTKLADRGCFASLENQNPLPDKVRYLAQINTELSNDCVNLYLKFLNQLFDSKLFKCKIVKCSGQNRVLWEINTTGMNYARALLHLTAFRYTHEYWTTVLEFHKRVSGTKNKSINNLFKIFQQIHLDFIRQGVSYYNGHGLIWDYSWQDKNAKIKFITFKEFRKRYTENLQSIYRYFIDKVAQPEPQPVYFGPVVFNQQPFKVIKLDWKDGIDKAIETFRKISIDKKAKIIQTI